MNIIPWRRRESLLPSGSDLEEAWNRFWTQSDLANHLPDVFRSRPFPAVNVAETEEGFSVTMDCPGLDEKDIHVEAMGNQLVISGERKWEQDKQEKEFRRVESQYGKFERSVELPDYASMSSDEIRATYRKGILTIQIPKREKTPSSKIPVHPG